MDMFDDFYHNNDPISARGLCQNVDGRYLIQNPPAPYLTTEELDDVSALPFMRDLHPYHHKEGKVKASLLRLHDVPGKFTDADDVAAQFHYAVQVLLEPLRLPLFRIVINAQ